MTARTTVMRDVTLIADRVLDRLAGGGQLLLLTDYDGTLAPIVPNPEAAKLPETVRADLWSARAVAARACRRGLRPRSG